LAAAVTGVSAPVELHQLGHVEPQPFNHSRRDRLSVGTQRTARIGELDDELRSSSVFCRRVR
jgi:hypothetical protein